MKHPRPSSPPPAPALRVGTFNAGCGFARKLPDILALAQSLSLDICALQEIGDPAAAPSSHPLYTLAFAAGPSNHEAGVGLLISRALAPRCREYHRSTKAAGRLCGVTLELSRGQRLLVVSAYMPTSLDRATPASASAVTARALYTELLSWARDVQMVMLLGDLNETLTPLDRTPAPAASSDAARRARSSAMGTIGTLPASSFVDEFRRLHPDVAVAPGHTHAVRSVTRSSSSRIDYVWTRGIDAACVRHVRIDTSLRLLSHHHVLWTEVALPQAVADRTPLVRMRLPNLRAATPAHEQHFVEHMQRRLHAQQGELASLAATSDAAALDLVASTLTRIANASAFATLPITGAAPLRSATLLALQQRRTQLSRLARATALLAAAAADVTRSPEWLRLYRLCVEHHLVTWTSDIRYDRGCDSCRVFLEETRRHVTEARADIRRERRRMTRTAAPRFDVSPAAAVHRMLRSDATPSHLHLMSVVDADGHLTTSAADLQSVMVSHFTSVFAVPRDAAAPLPFPPPAIFVDKPGICSEWYDELVRDISVADVALTIADAPRVSSPGEDGVSIGVWRIALQGSAVLSSLVATLFSSCLRSSVFPSAWKGSVIVPLLKDATKPRAMSNVRPISLQSCLGKLFNRILARRLAAVLAQHPILNPAQRGFVTGGTTVKCIDELLDAWQYSRPTTSRPAGREQYTLLYDIKQAYDSVQADVLLRALRRIHLPPAFVALVGASLSGLTSCVRTEYGLTRSFAVERSLRQGDPLAPLLFCIVVDPLHDVLERDPRTGIEHGLRIGAAGDSVYLASLGYADDTGIVTSSLRSLRVQNDWVHYFVVFSLLRLNAVKSDLVGRAADGTQVTDAVLLAAGILVDGQPIASRAHDFVIRYLGLHSTFSGSFAAQQQKSRALILLFARMVHKFRVPVARAVYMFNVFLLPKLSLALHFVHGRGTSEWVQQCDRMLVGSIRHAAASPVRISHSAVALAVGLVLPSWLETSIKVSELFLRTSSSDARWGRLGRMVMRSHCGSSVGDASVAHQLDHDSRVVRACRLAVMELQWRVRLREEQQQHGRHAHLLHRACEERLPLSDRCSSSRSVVLAQRPTHIAHDHWTGWVSASGRDPHPQTQVHVYTDGSFDHSSATSAWSVVIGDEWFDDNCASVPTDESVIQPHDVAGAALVGAAITCTQGVFPAELQAIARALAMLPASLDVHVHSDSRASIDAIRAYAEQPNERRRLRMAARPLLHLVHHLTAVRRGAGGSVQLSHVKAHTKGTDRGSIGNRMADYQANLARSRLDRSWPLGLAQVPLADCETHMTLHQQSGMQIIDDVRRTALAQLRDAALADVAQQPCREALLTPGMLELGCVVMRSAVVGDGGSTPLQQATFVHVSTNTVHFHWHRDADARIPARIVQLQCDECASPLTLTHLAACQQPGGVQYRRRLHRRLVRVLSRTASAAAWLSASNSVGLDALLARLVPAPPDLASRDRARAESDAQSRRARLMLGAFTATESRAAARTIGIEVAAEGALVMRRARLTCLDAVERHYTRLKEPP